MTPSRLAFCDSHVLRAWVEHSISLSTGRGLHPQKLFGTTPIVNALLDIQGEGVHLASTISAASLIITDLYKSASPFTGGTGGFLERKAFAREAATFIREQITLLSPASNHFFAAEELWLKLCQKTEKLAYAQFSDYVDAALIMESPKGHRITHALCGHAHVKYILEKSRFTGCVCLVL